METNMIAIGDWQTFISLKGEKLLMVVRRHSFLVIFPIIILLILTLLFIITSFVIYQRFFNSFPFFLTSAFLLISIAVSICTKLIIDWYFHVYVLTNRKILEFSYTPLTSYIVNDIMLDRVFCTEVDYQTSGFLHDLLNLGDVIITFDRPTHQEEFVLRGIQDCHKIGIFLTQQLLDGSLRDAITPIWFPGHNWGKR